MGGLDMIGYLNLILRLVIWFLLTANFTWPNIIIGVAIALLLPHSHKVRGSLNDWLQALGEILVAVPQAYMEAVEIIFRPHNVEEVTMEQVQPNRPFGLVFLDIFLITFTPKSIVLRYHEEDGGYEVHWVRRRKKV